MQQVQATRGDLAVKVNGICKIETSREARLAFGSAGRVDQIYVNEGDKVSSGDKLAKLDTDALELALAQAKLHEGRPLRTGFESHSPVCLVISLNEGLG
jgi:multidrug efflux pump subunit AcrA (membrane-fusion protein)